MQENSEVFRLHDVTDSHSRVTNSTTGRQVIDTEQAWKWRDDYYKRIRERSLEEAEAVKEAIHKRNLNPLNILGTKDVAQELGCSQGTAWNMMREQSDGTQIIPSFRIGRAWLTHAENIEFIRVRGKGLVQEGYADRTLMRMVWKADKGEKW